MSRDLIKVLLIEDNLGDRRLIEEMLAEAQDMILTLQSVDNLRAGKERLSQDVFDVVLLDLGLTDSSGLDTLQQLRRGLTQLPAIVVMSGIGDEDIAVQAVREGAQDYLVKESVDYRLLVRSLRYAIERTRFDEALRESEQRYRRLFQTMLQGVVYQDTNGNIISLNPAAERLLGKTPTDLLGHIQLNDEHPYFKSDGSPFPLSEHPYMVALKTGREVSNVVMGVYNPQEKDYRWISISAVPLFRPDETTPFQVYTIFNDITEQRKVEETLRKARDELELKVQERTASLRKEVEERKQVEEELQRMQHRLAHVARLSTMGEMVAGIAHEVNQPLYSIVNYAKACGNILSQENPSLTMFSKWINDIATAALRAGEIIKRLRDFVRKSELNRVPADINEVVQESMAMIAFETRRCNVSVQTSFDNSNPLVWLDRIQIQQVLVNLLRNACEALEQKPGGIKQLKVNTCLDDDYVEISVSDNGPGLPDNKSLQIFEPFVTSKPEGLGMGLAISKTIVEAHRGRIWTAQNPNGGAEFHFTLPLAKGEQSDIY